MQQSSVNISSNNLLNFSNKKSFCFEVIGAEDGKKLYFRDQKSILNVPGVFDSPGILVEGQPTRVDINIFANCKYLQ